MHGFDQRQAWLFGLLEYADLTSASVLQHIAFSRRVSEKKLQLAACHTILRILPSTHPSRSAIHTKCKWLHGELSLDSAEREIADMERRNRMQQDAIRSTMQWLEDSQPQAFVRVQSEYRWLALAIRVTKCVHLNQESTLGQHITYFLAEELTPPERAIFVDELLKVSGCSVVVYARLLDLLRKRMMQMSVMHHSYAEWELSLFR